MSARTRRSWTKPNPVSLSAKEMRARDGFNSMFADDEGCLQEMGERYVDTGKYDRGTSGSGWLTDLD